MIYLYLYHRIKLKRDTNSSGKPIAGGVSGTRKMWIVDNIDVYIDIYIDIYILILRQDVCGVVAMVTVWGTPADWDRTGGSQSALQLHTCTDTLGNWVHQPTLPPRAPQGGAVPPSSPCEVWGVMATDVPHFTGKITDIKLWWKSVVMTSHCEDNKFCKSYGNSSAAQPADIHITLDQLYRRHLDW